MKNLPIGVQSFEKLILGQYLYVDKTEHIYNLLATSGGIYFLSRPRRFGKSLLISTLEAIFDGQKELFKDLWIYDQNYDWQEHPVIRISFGGVCYDNKKTLIDYLYKELSDIANKYEVKLSEPRFDFRFKELIQKLSKINKVVILIDEYDKAMLDVIDNIELSKANRETLRGFYSVIKETDQYLKFVLLTGVSKFSKVSVFSGLNNLNDLTMDTRYAEMLGYTQTELEHYFTDRIDILAKYEQINRIALLEKIKHWYNGYRFSKENTSVYNPFSTLLLFDKNDFANHWFETGTPTFLLNLIKKNNYEMPKIETLNINEKAFSSYEIENLDILPLLLQTGYLTIKEYNKERNLYQLCYPNYEVKNAFLEQLTETYSTVRATLVSSYLYDLIDYLAVDDLDNFFETLEIFFANIPYDIQITDEKYYQTIFYLIFTLIGLKVEAEVRTNKGRIDAVIVSEDSIYIFEFKLEGTKEEAVTQIKNREYFQKYQNSNKKIVLVGVEFDKEKRNIGEWLVG